MLTLGHRTFADSDLLVMAIVNRTRDSFYDGGATFAEDRALERVRVADPTAAEAAIGWRPRTGLDEGLARTVEYYRGALDRLPPL